MASYTFLLSQCRLRAFFTTLVLPNQFCLQKTDYYLCGGTLLAKYSACSFALLALPKTSAECFSLLPAFFCSLDVPLHPKLAASLPWALRTTPRLNRANRLAKLL